MNDRPRCGFNSNVFAVCALRATRVTAVRGFAASSRTMAATNEASLAVLKVLIAGVLVLMHCTK
jgi:hypothetical protein